MEYCGGLAHKPFGATLWGIFIELYSYYVPVLVQWFCIGLKGQFILRRYIYKYIRETKSPR